MGTTAIRAESLVKWFGQPPSQTFAVSSMP